LFLRAATGDWAAVGTPGAVDVELSNDGQSFSSTPLQLLLTAAAQLRGLSPGNGPAEGGTVIDVELMDLAPANSVEPVIHCVFPDETVVTATYVNGTLVRCTTPPLATFESLPTCGSLNNASTPGNSEWCLWPASTWTWAPVDLRVADRAERTLGRLLFAYTRGATVTHIEPPDIVPEEEADPPTDLSVLVFGRALLPARETGSGLGLRCRFEAGAGNFIEVTGYFIRNGTVNCTLPGTAIASTWAGKDSQADEALLGIEVSLNGGQQYTSDGRGLVLRSAELVQGEDN
jgi:hypothetical protein